MQIRVIFEKIFLQSSTWLKHYKKKKLNKSWCNATSGKHQLLNTMDLHEKCITFGCEEQKNISTYFYCQTEKASIFVMAVVKSLHFENKVAHFCSLNFPPGNGINHPFPARKNWEQINY